MTKSKNTKRALLASILSMMLCAAMLVGTTFAWFTDTVSTAVNKIQAGTLDIVLETKDASGEWVNAENETLTFADANGNTDILWEPGATFNLPTFRIRNNGNLAAKILVKLGGFTGDEKLLEALEFETTISNDPTEQYNGSYDAIFGTPDGNVLWDWSLMPNGKIAANSKHTDTSPELTVSAHMKETAGNEYQGLSVDSISITVVATQLTWEYDSFDRDYDANAEYPKNYEVSTAAELQTALNSGLPVKLVNDIEVTGTAVDLTSGNAVIDLNGKSITTNPDANGYSVPFKVSGNASLTIKGDGNIRANGTNQETDYAIAVWARDGGTVRIEGGNFSNAFDDLIYASRSDDASKGGNISITGGTFASDYGTGMYGQPYGMRLLNLKNEVDPGSIEVYGGTFVNFDVNKPDDWPQNNPTGSWCAAGYHGDETVDDDGNHIFTVVKD